MVLIRSRDAAIGEGRKIVAMNQKMQRSRTVRVLRKDFLANPGRLQVPHVGLVGGCDRDPFVQRKRVEHRGFDVVGIAHGYLFDGLLVGQDARSVIALLVVAVGPSMAAM